MHIGFWWRNLKEIITWKTYAIDYILLMKRILKELHSIPKLD